MLELRGTQGQFVETSVGVLMSPSTKKCVMVAPVAYGKSICIANTIMRLDAPTIILQPNKELLEQNFRKYTGYGYSASICSQSLKLYQKNKRPYTEIEGIPYLCDEVSDVTFATVGSIKSMVDIVLENKVKYLIIDECHLNTKSASVIRGFIRDTKIKNVLGVTATPIVLANGFDGAMLKIMSSAKNNLFSTISHVVQIKEMIDAGYWSKLVYDIKHYSKRGLQFNTTGADYTLESLQVNYDENNIEKKCIEAVAELRAEGRKSIIVFVPNIKNAEDLSKKIKGSSVVHGKIDTKDRADILKRFKNLEIDVVINVEILTTGFDHPELDAIVMARPTASIALYYQIIGRITRIHDNKANGRIVDLSGNVCKFGKVENLNYEYIEGYGWGLFTDDRLLSNHPLKSLEKPTKDTLRKYASSKGIEEVKEHGKVVLWFGKNKGQQLQHIDKHYLTFMLEEFDFNGAKMKSLKNSIEIVLKLK